jgi:hypothetical protein
VDTGFGSYECRLKARNYGFPSVLRRYATEYGMNSSAGLVQEASSPLVTQLEEANGIVLGKTRMHELAEGYTSISAFFGPVLNPYRVDAHVGGEPWDPFPPQHLPP